MSTSQTIRDAVEASRVAADFTASEDPGKLIVSGSFSRDALDLWQDIETAKPDWLEFSCIDSSQDNVSPREAKDGELTRITLTFENPPGVVCLFTRDGWKSFLLNDQAPYRVRAVRLAFLNTGFETRAFSVLPWDDDLSAQAPTTQRAEAGPRRVVRCQSADFMAPVSVEPWLLVKCDDETDTGFIDWKEVAAEMLARSLPSELFCEGSKQCVVLLGQPQRKLEFGAADSRLLIPFSDLQLAVKWIYVEGTDSEVRHTFFSSELAREWPSELSFSDGLRTRLIATLDTANLLYKAHLRSGIKDTLKALADLRKTLADDVQKLLQQSKDLSASVWRDVAVAVGILAIRFSLDGVKSPTNSFAFGWIYIVVALYISVSYFISTSTNHRFIKILQNTQVAWRTKLYAFLDDGDYDTLASTPLTEALAAYFKTQRWTTWVVISVVVCMILAAFFEWFTFAQLVGAATAILRSFHCGS